MGGATQCRMIRIPLLKTEPDSVFFWSGRYINEAGESIGVIDDAARIAKSNGGNTLETLIELKGIEMSEWILFR